MAQQPYYPRVSPVAAGLRGRCPRCGRGRLFDGFITPTSACGVCGLDYAFMDGGDGPAVFVILILGFVVAGAALYVEVAYQPSYWVHAVLWLPLIGGLAALLLRPLKGLLLALQYHHKAAEGRLDR